MWWITIVIRATQAQKSERRHHCSVTKNILCNPAFLGTVVKMVNTGTRVARRIPPKVLCSFYHRLRTSAIVKLIGPPSADVLLNKSIVCFSFNATFTHVTLPKWRVAVCRRKVYNTTPDLWQRPWLLWWSWWNQLQSSSNVTQYYVPV